MKEEICTKCLGKKEIKFGPDTISGQITILCDCVKKKDDKVKK
jgi:hypothetical protein